MKGDLIVVFIGLTFIFCLGFTVDTITSEMQTNKIIQTCKESK